MDYFGNRTRRLQPIEKPLLPAPKSRRIMLRVALNKTNREVKIGPKQMVSANFQPSHTQPTSGVLPLVSPQHKVSTPLISPSGPGTGRLQTSQATASTVTTLNQSSAPKLNSTTSLYSPSHQGFPSISVARDEAEYPITPGQALRLYLSQLTEFEQAEILEYKQIYYFGLNSHKVISSISKPNFGYDDDRADYRVVIGDHIAYRYEITGLLGKGSFGQVVRCLDHKRKEEVAVKIIRNKRRFHQQGAVEIKILEILRDNDLEDAMGIVRMKNYIKFRKHICVTFEMLSINLYEFLKMNSFQGVSLSLVRRFAVQILISLKYTAELKVIHCDLKPENILLRNPDKSGIKIIDFGSACFENTRIYTYIQSRFYRAPEILLGIPYTPSIDMWSLGCILAELFYGYPLFPGESEKEQMQYTMEVLGLPPAHLLERSTRKKLFFEENGEVKLPANSRGRVHKPGTKTLEQAVRCQDRLFLDFIGRCLDWDPATRLRPEEALQHAWVLETAKPAGKEASRCK